MTDNPKTFLLNNLIAEDLYGLRATIFESGRSSTAQYNGNSKAEHAANCAFVRWRICSGSGLEISKARLSILTSCGVTDNRSSDFIYRMISRSADDLFSIWDCATNLSPRLPKSMARSQICETFWIGR